MAQEAVPQQEPGRRENSRWDTIRGRLFVLLNLTLSGPSKWQHTSPAPRQGKRGGRAEFLWSILLSLLLVVLTAAVLFLKYFVIPYQDISPDFGLLSRQNPNLLYVQYLLLSFLLLLFAGVLSGSTTGKLRAATRMSVRVSLIGFFSIFVLALVFGFMFSSDAGLELLAFGFDGQAVLFGLPLLLLGIGGGVLGGVLGSHVLHPAAQRIGGRGLSFMVGCLVLVELLGLVLSGLGIVGTGPIAFIGTPITEFAVPTAHSGPTRITAGPDGNLWFTENQANQIGRITPKGAVTEFRIPTADSGPEGITAGPDGNLWFTENQANQIGRITPHGTFTEIFVSTDNIIPIGNAQITAGLDGNLWFTEGIGREIGRITPRGTFSKFNLPLYDTRGPEGITAGPDGNLWFTDHGDDQIGRITPGGSITEFPVPTTSSDPLGITAGPDGAVWFTEVASNKIGRLTMDLTHFG
jgi:sugar lactone lactonase YvrE